MTMWMKSWGVTIQIKATNDHVMNDHVVDKLLCPLENDVQFKKSMNTTDDSDLYYARLQRWQKIIIIKRTSALKMNSHFFFREFRFCFTSLNMLNVGEFSRS